ncbi:hypothetical protein QUB63_21395 [Microcoleus sp. ARI1-B5]|uniref:hypothetical protein n=1 Tax=unclassified Microcoleus TaxID=2642155 RepID=UPI002FD6865E
MERTSNSLALGRPRKIFPIAPEHSTEKAPKRQQWLWRDRARSKQIARSAFKLYISIPYCRLESPSDHLTVEHNR